MTVAKPKVLIIKLGYSETLDKEVGNVCSLGDVLRSTVVLHAYKDHHVTWLTDKKCFDLLQGIDCLDRVLVFNSVTALQLKSESYDIVLNLEKVPGICALADSVEAKTRLGFSFDAQTGEAKACAGCEWVFELCQNETLKKTHQRPWSEALLEVIGLPWQQQEYLLGLKARSKVQHDIGFNWAVGKKWPNKSWPKSSFEALEKLCENKFSVSWQRGLDDLQSYVDWIYSCRMLVTNDSLGLHIALALQRPVLAMFGPTNSYETFLYNRGVAIRPEVAHDCIPCLEPSCHQERLCMEEISPQKVWQAVEGLFQQV